MQGIGRASMAEVSSAENFAIKEDQLKNIEDGKMVLSGIKTHRGISEIVNPDSYQKYIRDPMGKERRFQQAKTSNNSIVLEMN
jgi:hypothetical protein